MATKVQLFITCLGENFFSHVLKDMVTVLERLGLEVEMPEGQACCGQPLYNSGYQSQTLAPARNWLKVFGPTEGFIVAPSGSCAEFARDRYPQLFEPGTWEHDAALETASRTFEFMEFLARVLGVTDVGATFPHRVTYHASCHILRALGLRDEPKQLLGAVRGLEFVPLNKEETCCGFGGIFSVVNPEVSRLMMADKVNNIIASGAEAVVVSEPGCLMNVAGGLRKAGSAIRPMHIIEVLAAQE
jgi:L-lactate dehydrogenase complex protein LldE